MQVEPYDIQTAAGILLLISKVVKRGAVLKPLASPVKSLFANSIFPNYLHSYQE